MSDTLINNEPVESNEQVVESPVEQVAEAQSPAATNESWFSEDFADLVESKGFKSTDDVLKSYRNLESMVGNSVRIPSEDASDEAKAEFLNKIKDVDGVLLKSDEALLNKLGKPEAPEGYKLEELVKSEVFESVPNLQDELSDFSQIAHEAGLTTEQANRLVDMRMKTLEAQQAQLQENREASEAQLKKMWGEDFDNRLAAAKQVVKIYSEKYGDAVTDLVNSPAGNNPALLNMLSELAGMYKEQKHEGMSGSNFGMTPEMAYAKISEKRADSGFMRAYQDDLDPGHRAAVAEMTRLYALANGQKV